MAMRPHLLVVTILCLALVACSANASGQGIERKTQRPRYTVWAYKQVDGRWVIQDDRTFTTDNQAKARAYEKSVKSYEGWTATSNIPRLLDDSPQRAIRPKTIITEPGYYWVLIKAVKKNEFGTSVTVAIEPTGRTLVIPLRFMHRLHRVDGGDISAARLIGKHVILGLDGDRKADTYEPLGDKPPQLTEFLAVLNEAYNRHPSRCEQILAAVVRHQTSQFKEEGRWVIGRLKWEKDIDLQDLHTDASILGDGIALAFAKVGVPLKFRHPDCLPLDLDVPAGNGPFVVKQLQLVRCTPTNSGKLRLPLSDFVLAELQKEQPPSLVVMRVPTTWDGEVTWPGHVEDPERDTSHDIYMDKPKGQVLEFQVPPGEYGVHCFHPGRDRYLERVTVAAGETQTLPRVELPLLTYVVLKYCEHDGTRLNLETTSQAFYVSELYGHIITHPFVTSWFGNLTGLELGATLTRQPSCITRHEKDGIRLCFVSGDEVKIADLGNGSLTDFPDLGGRNVVWKKDGELFLEKKRPRDFHLGTGLDDKPPTTFGRSIPIRKGHVYRFDSDKKKYLVEVIEVTTDFPTYAKLAIAGGGIYQLPDEEVPMP